MSTPTEIRAQAIAFYALGYSYGNIDKQLRARYREDIELTLREILRIGDELREEMLRR